MTEAQNFRKILREKRLVIRRDLRVDDILYKLQGEGIIFEEEKQKISQDGLTWFDKADRLVDFLLRKDYKVFKVFCKILQESGKYIFLAKELKDTKTNEREGSMTEYHRKLLTDNMVSLVENVLVDDILVYLQEKFVFDEKDCQEICTKTNENSKVECLLSLLVSRGDQAFFYFKESLQKKYPYLDLQEKQVEPSEIREIQSVFIENGTPVSLHNEYLPTASIRQLKSFIPEKLDDFVGREDIITKCVNTITSQAEKRIVSLIASPGFGKSATAVVVAHRLYNAQRPVIFVNLKGVCTVEEVIVHICHSFGVAPLDDPLSSLRMFLQNVDDLISSVIVLDNVEQLLEETMRDEFICLLCESLQRFRILLTSRKVISNFHLPNCKKVYFKELDRESSILLVKNCYLKNQENAHDSDLDDEFLDKLAELCGDMPLALRIAAARLPDFIDDLGKLLECLKDLPLEVLTTLSGGTPEVQKCFQMSFDRLPKKQQMLFVRLSAFRGTFDKQEAREVTGLERHDLINFLRELNNRSLIEQDSNDQYSVHTLINSYLVNYVSGEQFPNERRLAQEKMVECFVNISYSLTLLYWSKDSSKKARSLLQAKACNIEKAWQLCEESLCNTPIDQHKQDCHGNMAAYEEKPDPKKILEILKNSKIYQYLTRLYYHFILHVLPRTTVLSFLNVFEATAKQSGNVYHEILLQCIKTHFYGRKFGWQSPQLLNCLSCVEKTVREHGVKKLLEEKNGLEALACYNYNKYLSTERAQSNELFGKADDSLQQYLAMREKELEVGHTEINVNLKHIVRVDLAISRMLLGRVHSYKVCKCCDGHKFYTRALQDVKELLGDHDLKLCCYKEVGDFYFRQKKYELAVGYYKDAMQVHYKLGATNSNISSVYLLKNFGLALSHQISREGEGLVYLREALDVAVKLFTENDICKAEVHSALAKTYYKLQDMSNAVAHAEEAIKCNNKSSKNVVLGKEMERVITKANGSLSIS